LLLLPSLERSLLLLLCRFSLDRDRFSFDFLSLDRDLRSRDPDRGRDFLGVDLSGHYHY
jgi:hypothetical protein